MIYALAIIAAWALFGIFGPPIKRGNKDRHTATGVLWRGDPHVLVQEVGEWKLCKIIGVALGLAVCGILYLLDLNPIFSVFALAIGDGWFRKFFIQDAAGHGAEIMSAERAGLMFYRAEEIGRLQYERNWQKALGFSGPGPEAQAKISACLDRTRWLARIVYRLGT